MSDKSGQTVLKDAVVWVEEDPRLKSCSSEGIKLWLTGLVSVATSHDCIYKAI